MEISKTIMVSVVLLSLSVGALGPPLFQVYVANFPLDEEGNLRVTQVNGAQQEPPWKVITVVENFNLTWTPNLDPKWVYSGKIDVGSVNVSGYSRMKLHMRVTNFTRLYQGGPNQAFVTCFLTSLYDYGEVDREWFQVHWDWDTATQRLFNELPQPDPWGRAIMRETVEPSIRISVLGGSNTPNGPVLPSISCLVSIGIYLRSE